MRTSSHKDDLAGQIGQLLLRIPIEGHDEFVAVLDDLGAQRVEEQVKGNQVLNDAGNGSEHLVRCTCESVAWQRHELLGVLHVTCA